MRQSILAERKTTTTGLFLPELNVSVFGAYFGDVFAQQRPTSEINAQLIWRIPLGRLTNGGRLQQYDARIAYQANELERTKARINEEVIRAKGQIEIAEEQMEIAAEGSGSTSASVASRSPITSTSGTDLSRSRRLLRCARWRL